MKETSKTTRLRSSNFYTKFLTGHIIDIGAGNDLVVPGAERFDKSDGDANDITAYRKSESYDTVYSSHCLEHMINPKEALKKWWQLIKPGGHLVLVVPDEDLYEQGFWPSVFNGDHKATFTLKETESWSPVSHNLVALVATLPSCQIISVEQQDKGYDYLLQTRFPPPEKKTPSVFFIFLKKVLQSYVRIKFFRYRLDNFLFFRYSVPVDQTRRGAVAQIQVVARKSKLS
jgi:SAM-dependent methyltransferase